MAGLPFRSDPGLWFVLVSFMFCYFKTFVSTFLSRPCRIVSDDEAVVRFWPARIAVHRDFSSGHFSFQFGPRPARRRVPRVSRRCVTLMDRRGKTRGGENEE